MPTIQDTSDLCTVIVTVEAATDVLPEIVSHARDGLALFEEHKGFISGAVHQSADGTRMVQYLQWANKEDHLACMDDPRWDTRQSTRAFLKHVPTG